LALFLSGSALDTALYQESKCTHGSEISAQVSIMAGRICSYLLQGSKLRDAIEDAYVGIDPAIKVHPKEISRCSRGGYAPDVLCAALSFLSVYDSFSVALEESLRFAGAANYCPVLVGSIGACLHRDVPLSLLVHPECPDIF
jgi:hypothetical protein